jgi:8-oxo-dGTP diphosphatase
VLLIQMKKHPLSGRWALPGGLVAAEEKLDESAARILLEQTGVSQVYLEQLYTFGAPERDPLGRVVSVAYISLVPPEAYILRTTEKYQAVAWRPASKVQHLAYDHDHILTYARQRLEWKLEYTNVVWSLLPPKFTLTQLQQTYEIILERTLDKRNFRKKILALGLISALEEKTSGEAHRPAMLYRFNSQEPEIVRLL